MAFALKGSENEAEEDDLSDVYMGILNDDVELLQKGLRNKVNMNLVFKGDYQQQYSGMTPLSLAAALNKINSLQYLLDNGANVNETFASLRTSALMTASFHGHQQVVELLLRNGANIQAIDLQGSTALGYAFGGSRSIEVIQMLLSHGINVNQKNMLGMNSLLLVAGYGDEKLVRLILEHKADPNSVNDFGHSALHLVIVGKRTQLKKLLCDGTKGKGKLTLDNFNNLKSAEVALRDWAARNKNLKVDSKKLDKAASLMNNIGNKILRNNLKTNEDEQEVIKQRVEAIWLYRQQKLLEKKRANKKTNRLESFLNCSGKKNRNEEDYKPYLAAPSRTSKKISTEKDREIFELKEKFSKILLMIAEAGCNVEITEKTFGMTALDMAILLEDIECTGILVSRGADPGHLLKMFALSDLHEAIITGDKKMLQNLICYDFDLNINQSFSAFNVDSKQENADEEAEVVISDEMTPLTVAVQMPDDEHSTYKIVKTLIKHKADVDLMGSGGSCPLAEAARMGNLKMCQMLIANGATVDQLNPKYQNASPFLVAAIFNRSDVAQFLSDKNAKMDISTTNGRCGLSEAFKNDNQKIIETILRGSLAQAFQDRNSFTYEVVVKYQRPDKNMNLIMKMISDYVKKLDSKSKKNEFHQQNLKMNKFHEMHATQPCSFVSDYKPSTNEQRGFKMLCGNLDKMDDIQEYDQFICEKNKQLRKNDRSVESELDEEIDHFMNKSKEELYEKEKITFESLEAHKSALMKDANDMAKKKNKEIKNSFNQAMSGSINQIEKCTNSAFKEVKKEARNERMKIEENIDKTKENMGNWEEEMKNSLSRKLKTSDETVYSQVESGLIKFAEEVKEDASETKENFNIFDFSNSKKEAFKTNFGNVENKKKIANSCNLSHPFQEQIKHNENENEEEEEEWEDEKQFEEKYQVIEPFMMTTPILGRCKKVRENFKQSDSYIRDVVSAGQIKRPSLRIMKKIEDEEDEEEDEEKLKNNFEPEEFRT